MGLGEVEVVRIVASPMQPPRTMDMNLGLGDQQVVMQEQEPRYADLSLQIVLSHKGMW